MEKFLFESCEALVKEIFWERYPPERGKPYCRREPVNGKTLSAQIWEVLEDLQETLNGERKRKIIILFFQLDGGSRKTLAEIGRGFSPPVSRERVRQIRNLALRQLRHHSRSLRLKLYLENDLAHEAAAASLKKIEEARENRGVRQEAEMALWERFLQPQNRSFEERQGEIRALRQAFEKTQVWSNAFSPNRFINKILRRGILFSDLKTFDIEELASILGMPGSKTEQCIREMWQIARKS